MDPNVLREQLTKLHDELRHVSSVDPRSNQLLKEIMEDIKRLVAAPDETSLPDRLEKIAVQFEVDHPTLAASSRRLVDLLGKAGL
jgi:hypothetical protein